jgi:hypothetical protein
MIHPVLEIRNIDVPHAVSLDFDAFQLGYLIFMAAEDLLYLLFCRVCRVAPLRISRMRETCITEVGP